jgi:hypothetical protein
MIEITRAQPRHAVIVPYLRQADAEEIRAATGLSPAFAVAYSIAHSKHAQAVLLDDKPVALFGVGESAGPGGHLIGIPWLVATDEIERHPVRFFRTSKKIIAGIREKYDCLMNWVDTRNSLSIRWLEWAGFSLGEPQPWGFRGSMFRCFWWRR